MPVIIDKNDVRVQFVGLLQGLIQIRCFSQHFDLWLWFQV